MAYIGSSPTKVVSRQSANIFTYTATANQTAFTGADANGNTLACSPSDIMVHMNGLRLEESDYTATTTTVTLGSGAAAGDEVTITAFLTFESADHYDKSTSDTRYVNTTGDTMTGALAVDAGNGDQLTLDNDGERFTQISLKNNGSQYAAVWYDNSINVLVNHAASGKGYVVQTGGSTDRLVIDSSGRVTMPYQPQFVVQGDYNNWTQITTGAQWYQLTGATGVSSTASGSNILPMGWRTNNYGGNNPTGSGFNATSGLYTAPVAGTYMFAFQSYTTKYANSGGQYYHINGYYNGNNMNDYTIYGYNEATNAYQTPEITKILRMSANDTFEFRIYVSTANTFKFYPTYTMLSGYLLG